MRHVFADERGISLITVLGLLTFMLLTLGIVISLAPAHLRRTDFETDVALALYAAESGINHALARIDQDLRQEKQSLTEWLSNRSGGSGTLELQSGEPSDLSGKYHVHISRMSGTDGLRVTSEGVYNERIRIVELAVKVGGALFPRAITGTDPSSGEYYDEDYVVVEVTVPEWGGGDLPECDYNPINPVIADQGECAFYHDFTNASNLHIKNTTVHFKGNVNFTNNFTVENSNLYIDKDLTIQSTKGDLIGENSFYILGKVTIGGNATVAGQGAQLGEEAPWNYFYVREKLKLHGNPSIGSLSSPNRGQEAMPDIAFLTETVTEITIIDELNGNVKCACGIYSAGRNVEFNGNAFNMYGGVVGDNFSFANKNSPGNIKYDPYESRMHQVELQRNLKVIPGNWTERRA